MTHFWARSFILCYQLDPKNGVKHEIIHRPVCKGWCKNSGNKTDLDLQVGCLVRVLVSCTAKLRGHLKGTTHTETNDHKIKHTRSMNHKIM